MSTPRSLRAWRSGVAAAGLVLIASVVALPFHHQRLAEGRADRDATDELLGEAEDRRAALARSAEQERAALDATRDERDEAVRDAFATGVRVDEAYAARKAEEAALGEAMSDLASTAGELDRVSDLLGLQRLLIAPLRECLGGVERANHALSAGDTAGAAGALDGASDACLRARSGSAAPALPYDFPDPHVVRDGSGRWWAYATNSTAGAVQMISSDDLVDWRVEGNALNALPPWARSGATWAPAVVNHGGRWLLYYTVREKLSGKQCISVATSASPAGPFHDATAGPLVCERDEGGSIDPAPIVDGDGRLYLHWKTELDTLGRAAELRGARLDRRGTAVAGPVAILLRASQAWEGRTIEGPAMLRSGGYHLLYSGGSWNSSRYSTGAARCDTVLGPCVRQSASPVLHSRDGISGPGGLSVFPTGQGTAAAYHAWQGEDVGYPENRYLHIGHVAVVDGAVSLSS